MLAASILTFTAFASAVPYAFPNGTMTTHPCTHSGMASLITPTEPSSQTIILHPRSTDSICSSPGRLICSMDGKQVGVCGFTGDGDLQWKPVPRGTECRCKGGECTIVDV